MPRGVSTLFLRGRPGLDPGPTDGFLKMECQRTHRAIPDLPFQLASLSIRVATSSADTPWQLLRLGLRSVRNTPAF